MKNNNNKSDNTIIFHIVSILSMIFVIILGIYVANTINDSIKSYDGENKNSNEIFNKTDIHTVSKNIKIEKEGNHDYPIDYIITIDNKQIFTTNFTETKNNEKEHCFSYYDFKLRKDIELCSDKEYKVEEVFKEMNK